ncbi:MAG: chorismate mutase [Acidobacteriota bacterium]
MDDLEGWRKKIDEIDFKLIKLLNERSQCAIEIGRIKEKLNLEIYDPGREKIVIENVRSVSDGPLTEEAVRRLFEHIFDESRRAQQEVKNAQVANRNNQEIKES